MSANLPRFLGDTLIAGKKRIRKTSLIEIFDGNCVDMTCVKSGWDCRC